MFVVETFSDRLKELMDLEELNNTTLAENLGINRKTVGRWILNQHMPNYLMLIQLARYFEVSVDYLLGESGYVRVAFPADFDALQVKTHFAESINDFLKENDISENAFSKMLGLKHDSIGKWTKGSCMPEAETFVKLSRAMGISVDALLGIG